MLKTKLLKRREPSKKIQQCELLNIKNKRRLQQMQQTKPRMRRLNVVTLKMVREKTFPYETNTIRSPYDVVNLAKEYIGDADREQLALLCLDTKNKICALHTISIGNLNSSIVHPRECFKVAIMSNAASIILFHNHPSGNCEPSREDLDVTKRIKEVGQLLGIELLDHLIVSDRSHYSMKEKGFI